MMMLVSNSCYKTIAWSGQQSNSSVPRDFRGLQQWKKGKEWANWQSAAHQSVRMILILVVVFFFFFFRMVHDAD